MYSPELERLIDAAVADGIITDKERQVLFRRASNEGVDLDEFEIILEGRLAKVKREIEKEQMTPPPLPPQFATKSKAPSTLETPRQSGNKSQKYGEIRKCPNCGATLNSFASRCIECGHEFVGVEAVSSAKRFSEMLHKINEKYQDKESGSFIGEIRNILTSGMDSETKQEKVLCSAIESFPIPNTKEDLMEFMFFLQPKATKKFSIWTDDRMDIAVMKSYRLKFQECANKAKVLFKGDPQVEAVFRQLGLKF